MNNGVAIVNGSRVLRILKYAVAFLLFSLVIISSTFKINDPDTTYYMAHGKYILQHGWRDYSSVYVYSSPNADVCFPEWFFHVMTYAVYAIGRWNGLVMFQILLVLSIFTVIFKNSIYSKYSFFSAAIFILLAVLVGMERFMLRADTFGILMSVSFYFILKKHMERGFLAAPYRHIRPLVMLLVIQMLWANTHPSFPLGLIIASAFLGNELFNPFIEAFAHRRRAVFSVKKVKFLGFLLFGCVAVSSFNPYGPGAFFWPFRFLFGSSLLHSQLEWASTFAANDVQHLSVTMYKVMFFGALALLAIDFKHVKLIDALILIPFFYLSARYVRNLAIFAFFSALILPAYLDNIAFRLENAINKKNIIQRIRLPFEIIICVTLVFFIIKLDYGVITNKLYIRDQRSRRFGFGVSELIYPVKAADFILQNNLKGRLFNDYGTGDYFDWRLFPKYQTFIDGHSHTFDLFDYYAKVMAGIIPYQAAVDRYKINFFILNHIFPDTPQLIAQLYKDKNWVPVYFDELSVIFIADKPENRSIINKYAIDFSSDKNFHPERLVAIYDKVDYPVARLNRGIFFNNIGLFEKAAYEFEKAVEEDPSFYVAYSNLGSAYYQLAQYQRSLGAYETSLRIKPDFAPAHFNLALLYQKTNRLDKAIEEYQKTLKIRHEYPTAHYNLGTIYEAKAYLNDAKREYETELFINPNFAAAQSALDRLNNSGLPSQAVLKGQDIEDIRASLKNDPNNAQLHFQLAIAYGASGEHDKALEEFKKTVELDPKFVLAHFNLGNIYSVRNMVEEACQEYEKAVELDPKLSLAHLNLGIIYCYQKKDKAKAIEHWQKYLELEPNDPQAKIILKEIDNLKRQ